ncbi:MAG: FHA domain-containing protein, partial [Actinomycetota bacterium]|nr:FHA domain-containing protein [Actinomycetota bacterium]
MRLRFTVVGTDARCADAAVLAPRGTPVSAVLEDLRFLVAAPDARLYAGGRAVDPSAALGLPPLLDGAVLSFRRPAHFDAVAGPLELRVVAGPDSGAIHRLGPGPVTVGRAPAVTVRLDDPDVSRLHAVLEVTPAGVRVRDVGSTNGSRVRSAAGTHPGRLSVGDSMAVGRSILQLVVPEVVAAAARADGEGHLEVNRPPRITTAPAPVEIALPRRPVPRDAPRFPLLMLLLPLLLGAVLFALSRNPTYLLFLLLSPLMLVGNYVSDRASGRRGNRKAQREYDAKRAAAQERVLAAVAAEETAVRQGAPDAAELLATATAPGPRLWERRIEDGDFLAVRLALADLPSSVVLRDPFPDGPDGVSHPDLADVPLSVSLRTAGVTGVAGRRSAVLGLARSVIAQVATWHSHRTLQLILLGGRECAADWEWARHLPHLEPARGEEGAALVGWTAPHVAQRVGELLALLEQRQRTGLRVEGTSWRTASLVVLDGARALRSVPGVARLLAEGPPCGIYVLCLEAEAVALPAECAATAVLDDTAGPTLTLRVAGRRPVSGVVPDLVSAGWASRIG